MIETLLMFAAVISFLVAAFISNMSLQERPHLRVNPIALGLLFWAMAILLGR